MGDYLSDGRIKLSFCFAPVNANLIRTYASAFVSKTCWASVLLPSTNAATPIIIRNYVFNMHNMLRKQDRVMLSSPPPLPHPPPASLLVRESSVKFPHEPFWIEDDFDPENVTIRVLFRK